MSCVIKTINCINNFNLIIIITAVIKINCDSQKNFVDFIIIIEIMVIVIETINFVINFIIIIIINFTIIINFIVNTGFIKLFIV